jgi:hypothetical protein
MMLSTSAAPPDLRIGHVNLKVADLERSGPLLSRPARLRAQFPARQLCLPLSRRLPPSHRAQHLGERGETAPAAWDHRPLPLRPQLPDAPRSRPRAEVAGRRRLPDRRRGRPHQPPGDLLARPRRQRHRARPGPRPQLLGRLAGSPDDGADAADQRTARSGRPSAGSLSPGQVAISGFHGRPSRRQGGARGRGERHHGAARRAATARPDAAHGDRGGRGGHRGHAGRAGWPSAAGAGADQHPALAQARPRGAGQLPGAPAGPRADRRRGVPAGGHRAGHVPPALGGAPARRSGQALRGSHAQAGLASRPRAGAPPPPPLLGRGRSRAAHGHRDRPAA